MKKLTKFLLISVLFFIVGVSFANGQTIEITDNNVTVSSYTDKTVNVNGKSELHLTGTENVLTNTSINLTSEDAWVFFDNIRPSDVIATYLQNIKVNGAAAVNRTNVRVSIYLHGTVVIPHPAAYQPLRVYTGQNFEGQTTSYPIHTIHSLTSTSFNNKIRSIVLKRGYQATLATNADGTGYSRVFIADTEDLVIPVMPQLLDEVISFIRVVEWQWVTKKGWCGTGSGGGNSADKVHATWYYSWSADQSTRTNSEYVVIKQNAGWPGWGEISGKNWVSHVLGYNEPDRPDQSNLTFDYVLSQWPEFMKSGLRLGSPATSDPFNSWSTYNFIDKCDELGYRVDYVAIHAYWGGMNAQTWYNRLKAIHDRTKRPIWITEWNNGANWTTETWPTADRSLSSANATKQLNELKAILNVLDTTSFIERYSIYNWVQDARAIILADTLTPAGKYYKESKSAYAFSRKHEVIPHYVFKKPTATIALGTSVVTIAVVDPNGDYFKGSIVEKKVDDGAWEIVLENNDPAKKTHLENIDLVNNKRVRFRVRSKYANDVLSDYTNEVGYDVAQEGTDIQFGKLSSSSVGWNNVYFNTPYSAIPVLIAGAPTNTNGMIRMTTRSKLVSASSRFQIQIAPWEHQSVTTLSNEETVPYLTTKEGTYDLGGLKAISKRESVGGVWVDFTFPTPFETVPVVFASQLNPVNTFATSVRIKDVTTNGFKARLQKESAVKTSLSNEMIGYFAVETGTGNINGKKVIVGKTTNTFISPTAYRTINYGDSIGDPVFLTQLQTCNDDTVTAVIRCLSVSNKFANVIKQRELSTGVTVASTDGAGWMVIESDDILQGVRTISVNQLSLYPNPVMDYIYLNEDVIQVQEVQILNLLGVVVKSVRPANNRIDVSDLPSGYYILKTDKIGSGKFMKL